MVCSILVKALDESIAEIINKIMLQIGRQFKSNLKRFRIRECFTESRANQPCAPYPPPVFPPPCCPMPPFASNPRTKYQVNFFYVSPLPPTTEFRDFVDRIAQTCFWTEIIRGNLILCVSILKT